MRHGSTHADDRSAKVQGPSLGGGTMSQLRR